MPLGKEVRLNRLYNKKSGRILVIALDHAIGWGVVPGIEDIAATMEKIIEAQPDAVTMLKGTAEKVFRPYAGAVPWIMKATTFSPYQPAYDTAVATVDEAVRLGADAVAIGCTVCGDRQQELLSQLGEFVRQSSLAGYPTVDAHLSEGQSYRQRRVVLRGAREVCRPRRRRTRRGHRARRSTPAIRRATPGSFAATPAKLVVSGGAKTAVPQRCLPNDLRRDEGRGHGRDVWPQRLAGRRPGRGNPALKHIIHEGGGVDEALDIAGQRVPVSH